jgi:hypothetical protein
MDLYVNENLGRSFVGNSQGLFHSSSRVDSFDQRSRSKKYEVHSSWTVAG